MNEHEAVIAALRGLARAEDGSVDEKMLIDTVAQLIDFDSDAELRHKATRVVRRHKMPGFGESEGQLTLPGLAPYAYEPGRLIADSDGHVVEQANAWPEFKRAEAERARVAARKQQAWADRKTLENEAFTAWALRKSLAGHDQRDIIFGTFVEETGVWSAGSAQPEAGPDEAGAL